MRECCQTSMRYSYQFLCVLFIAYSTKILKVLQKLMLLLRVYQKLICRKNEYLEYLETFKIILFFPLFAKLYLLCEKQNARKLVRTRQATGFKSLRVNCWEINQVTSKCQIDFLEKTCKGKSKTEKVNITIGFYIFKIF